MRSELEIAQLVRDEIAERKELIGRMVGTLYPRILESEIEMLNKVLDVLYGYGAVVR